MYLRGVCSWATLIGVIHFGAGETDEDSHAVYHLSMILSAYMNDLFFIVSLDVSLGTVQAGRNSSIKYYYQYHHYAGDNQFYLVL